MTSPGKSTKGYKWAIAALGLVIVVLLGVISELSRSGNDAPTAATPASPGQSASATASPSPTGADEETQRFLLEELPKRSTDDALALGSPDAKIVMTEWADYRCPFCSVFAEETLPQLQRYIDDGSLRVEFRDLAIFGDESVKAATAARAAGLQGKYFEFQHALFVALPNQGHPDIEDELVLSIVKELGLDVEQFKRDWADPVHETAVQQDSAEAKGYGITSTPAFVIGGVYVAGAQPLTEFTRVIDEQLTLHG